MIACDALLERRIGRAHQLLVVLDEIDAGLDQLADQFGRLVRTKAERRLDDRADDRPAIDAGEPAAAGNAELRAGMGAAEGLRQLHVDDADAGHALDRIDAADRDGHQGRKIGADGIERKGDIDIGAAEAAHGLRRLRARSGARHRASGRIARTRAATRAFSSSRLAGNRHEGAGRLVAGDLVRHRLDAAGRFDAVGER